MATSGSAIQNVISNGKIHLQINWSQASQDVSGNYTKINWNVKLFSDGGGWNIQVNTNRTLRVVVNGSTVYSGGVNVSVNSGQSKTLASGTATVYHNADGTKSFSFSATQDFSEISFSGATIYKTVTASGSNTLTTIPRVSKFDTWSFTFTPSSAKMNFYITAGSTAFTHRLRVDLVSSGSSHDFLIDQWNYRVDSVNKRKDFTYTLNASQITKLLNAMKSTNTLRLRTYMATYNGSTLIGELESWANATVDASSVAPKFTDFSFGDGENLAAVVGLPQGEMIGGLSRFQFMISSAQKAAAQYGAVMSKYVLSVGNLSKEVSYGTGEKPAVDLGALTQTGTLTASVKAVDSRGNQTTVTKQVVVHPYAPPLSSASVARVNNYERETKLLISGEFTSVGTNAVTAQYRYSEQQEQGEWISVPLSVSQNQFTAETVDLICDKEKTFYFEVKLTDKLRETVTPYTLLPGETPITFLEDGSIDIKGEYLQNGKPVFSQGNKVLWNSASYMDHTQTAPLSEPVSKQNSGIVLVFSPYRDGKPLDYEWQTFFVSKKEVELHEGQGHTFMLNGWKDSPFDTIGLKYLYIYNDKITGYKDNIQTGTSGTGIKYYNLGFVLRHVIGV